MSYQIVIVRIYLNITVSLLDFKSFLLREQILYRASYISKLLNDLHNIYLFLNLFSSFFHASLYTTLSTALTATKALLARQFADDVLKEAVIF